MSDNTKLDKLTQLRQEILGAGKAGNLSFSVRLQKKAWNHIKELPGYDKIANRFPGKLESVESENEFAGRINDLLDDKDFGKAAGIMYDYFSLIGVVDQDQYWEKGYRKLTGVEKLTAPGIISKLASFDFNDAYDHCLKEGKMTPVKNAIGTLNTMAWVAARSYSVDVNSTEHKNIMVNAEAIGHEGMQEGVYGWASDAFRLKWDFDLVPVGQPELNKPVEEIQSFSRMLMGYAPKAAAAGVENADAEAYRGATWMYWKSRAGLGFGSPERKKILAETLDFANKASKLAVDSSLSEKDRAVHKKGALDLLTIVNICCPMSDPDQRAAYEAMKKNVEGGIPMSKGLGGHNGMSVHKGLCALETIVREQKVNEEGLGVKS